MTCVKCDILRTHQQDCGFCRGHLCIKCCDGECERVMDEMEEADRHLEELLKTAPEHIRRAASEGGLPF